MRGAGTFHLEVRFLAVPTQAGYREQPRNLPYADLRCLAGAPQIPQTVSCVLCPLFLCDFFCFGFCFFGCGLTGCARKL